MSQERNEKGHFKKGHTISKGNKGKPKGATHEKKRFNEALKEVLDNEPIPKNIAISLQKILKESPYNYIQSVRAVNGMVATNEGVKLKRKEVRLKTKETETAKEPEATANHAQKYLSNLLNPKFSTRVFRVFWEFLFQDKNKILISRGGTRSTKTYSKIQGFIALSYLYPDKKIIIARRTVKLIKDGPERDLLEILKENSIFDDFKINKTDRTYKNIKTGSEIQLRAFATADDARGVKSDFVLMNEATEMGFNLFQQLIMRCEGKVVLDFNPTDEFTWCNQEIEISRKIHKKDVQISISTYKDNFFLSEHQVSEIELLRDTQPHLWKIYGLGEYGLLEGKIFPSFETCTPFEFDQIPDGKSGYGVDWGFNDPTTVIYAKFDSRYNRLYLHELDWFDREMKNVDRVANTIQNHSDYAKRKYVIIDHKPEYLHILQSSGINALNADKGAGSIKNGIDIMKRVEIVITENSYNLLKEFQSYSYAQDKDENWLDEPVDFMNHGIDASRYIFTFIVKNFNIDFGIKLKK